MPWWFRTERTDSRRNKYSESKLSAHFQNIVQTLDIDFHSERNVVFANRTEENRKVYQPIDLMVDHYLSQTPQIKNIRVNERTIS